MKVSQIRFSEHGSDGLIFRYYIDLPNTDAIGDLDSNCDVLKFIETHGDLEVVKNGNRFNVPTFANGREQFIAAKVADCAKWGCN